VSAHREHAKANRVDLKEALSYPSSRVRRLLEMTMTWDEAPVVAERVEPRFQPKQQPGLAERIGEAETATLINQFLSGTTQDELAQRYGTSASSIKRLLQARDVRLWSRKPNRS
jgi:Trp operon repressor